MPDNNIIQNEADQVRKYHLGQLTPTERHALELAALEDPFLAEALDGFGVDGTDHTAELNTLRAQLAARISETDDEKVIPINRSSNRRWLKIAAALVLIAGAGLLFFNINKGGKMDTPIAQRDEVTPTQDSSPSITSVSPGGNNANTQANNLSVSDEAIKADSNSIAQSAPQAELLSNGSTAKNESSKPSIQSSKGSIQSSEASKELPEKPNETAEYLQGKSAGRRAGSQPNVDAVKDKKATADDRAVSQMEVADVRKAIAQPTASSPSIAQARQASSSAPYQNNNVFRGRITDVSNNALPFAKVTNSADNIGTYADAKGYFSLTSPDTVMAVKVKSIGFTDTMISLRQQSFAQQLVLNEDNRASQNELVIGNNQLNANQSRNSTMVLEQPEPVDGWRNYNTYLVNNINVPDNFKSRPAEDPRVVELSFDVNELGEPVNIAVTQSQGDACDKEAIRLVKEGPRWKKKGRNRKTTVSIPF